MYAANKGAFSKLARIRLAEANILFGTAKYSGAYYLAGYAVECALKSKIAITLAQYDIPDPDLVKQVYAHELKKLLKLAGLETKLANSSAKNPQLAANWNIVAGENGWSEESRYNETITEVDAQELIDAIEDSTNGILSWIEQN